MGYTTDFEGYVTVDPPLNESEVSYLQEFAKTRRMKREKGPYYAHDDGNFGQDKAEDVLEYNSPPDGQPGLWNQWVPNDDGDMIMWDGNEKFYSAPEWMQYLIDHFLKEGAAAEGDDTDERFKDFTFNHVLSGTIEAQGEDPSDMWRLVVIDNEVHVQEGSVTYGDLQRV